MAIRRESVELSLNDVDFTTGMAKAAASTAILNHELGNLDGNSVRANRSTTALGDGNGGIAKTGKQARQSSADIDKYSGRLGILVKSALALGPALVPVSVAAIPAISGLAMGFGAAAGAAGVAVLAFNGVGDAVKAMDTYALQPTAANLQKMHQAMQDLGPAGANFARFIDGLEPQLRALQGSAREGLLPGVQQGIEELLPMLPKVEDFIGRIGSEMGNLAAEAGKGLTGDAGFQKFAHYIDTEGVPIMDAFAKTTGKVASGLVALAADMAPLTGDFMGGMEHAADSFQKWAEGLDKTQGFRDFVTYIENEGPQVVDLLKTVASTALDIAEAFAPIGSVTLPILSAVAKIIGTIASSPLGPVAAAFISINAAMSLSGAALARLRTGWLGVASAAKEAATAEEVAATAATGKGRIGTAGKVALTAALVSNFIPQGTPSETGDLTTSNLRSVGSNLALANSSAGGFGQGTVNKIFGISDAITGPLLGHTSELTSERNSASSVDQQLAGMVSAGQAKQAAAAFDILSASAKKSGASVKEIAETFPHYTAAAKDSAAATSGSASSMDRAAAAAREERKALTDLVNGYHEAHAAALQAFDATTGYGSSLSDLSAQAKKGEKGLSAFTQAGRDNREAVSGMIGAYNNQTQATKNSVAGYHDAVGAVRAFGRQTDLTSAQVQDLIDKIDKPRKLTVTADTQQALSAIERIKAEAASIPRTLRTDYIVNQINSVSRPRVNMPGSADGSTVPKDGGPYEDRYHYLLAPGEEVISNRNGQADRFRPLLKAINAGRLADGGTAARRGSDIVGMMPGVHGFGKLDDALSKHLPDAAKKAIKAIEKAAKAQDNQAQKLTKSTSAAADRDKAAADAAAQHRDAVLEDMASIKQSIAARYQSDVFGKVDSSSIAYQIDPVTGKYVDAAQSSKLQTNGILDGLKKDIADAKASQTAATSVQGELKGSGLSADQIAQAVLYMGQNASIGQMQALASDKSLATQYAQLYTQRQQVSNAAGQSMANIVDSRALVAAQVTADKTAAMYAIAEQRAKNAAQRQKLEDRRYEALTNRLDHMATQIGNAVGAKINTASKGGK